MKTWVISVGGSMIAPDDVDAKFIDNFHDLILKYPKDKFVVITGGGATARRYIGALRKFGKGKKDLAEYGIAIGRMHASLLSNIFGKRANHTRPKSLKNVKNLLEKNQIVFTGALRFHDNMTSDGTAADIAAYLDCPFINLTNIRGLYTSDPKKNKTAKFIPKITWKKFNKIAQSMEFKAGQHFVLDQSAAKRILIEKIPTYITGSLADLKKILSGKSFKGTLIKG